MPFPLGIRRKQVLELAPAMGIQIKMLQLDLPIALDARSIVGPRSLWTQWSICCGFMGTMTLDPPPIEIPSRSRAFRRPTSTPMRPSPGEFDRDQDSRGLLQLGGRGVVFQNHHPRPATGYSGRDPLRCRNHSFLVWAKALYFGASPTTPGQEEAPPSGGDTAEGDTAEGGAADGETTGGDSVYLFRRGEGCMFRRGEGGILVRN